jgi:hypothetical protein
MVACRIDNADDVSHDRLFDEDLGYSIGFKVPGSGNRTLYAFTEGQINEPATIEANEPSSWYRKKQGADLVIISHGDFLASLDPLKAFRESQGLTVALVDVQDLYDEFNFGIKVNVVQANTVASHD